MSGGFGTFSIKSTRKTPLRRRVALWYAVVSALRCRFALFTGKVPKLPLIRWLETTRASSVSSAVVAKRNSRGIEDERWCVLVDRPLRGMGKVVLSVYRTYIMPLSLQKHHFNQIIPIHWKSTFLAESCFCVETITYRLAVFKKVRVLEHYTNDKKQYLLAEKKK